MSLDIIAAMEEEIAELPKELGALKIGVGKVNAAAATVELICLSGLIRRKFILIVGTAAAADPSLEIGDVVIASGAGYHDVDVTALNFAPGQIPFEDTWFWESDGELAHRALKICQELGLPHTHGPILTGDQFVTDPERVAWIHETFGASAIDMETAAVAQVCHRFNVPLLPPRWLGIRVISDLADKSAPVDFSTFLPQAAKTIAQIVTRLIDVIDPDLRAAR